MAVAEEKAYVEIEPGQSAALVVPRLGGNLQVREVLQVHVAACALSTRDVNVRHHIELSYDGRSVSTRCLRKAAAQAGQRMRLVQAQLLPGHPPQPLWLLVMP